MGKNKGLELLTCWILLVAVSRTYGAATLTAGTNLTGTLESATPGFSLVLEDAGTNAGKLALKDNGTTTWTSTNTAGDGTVLQLTAEGILELLNLNSSVTWTPTMNTETCNATVLSLENDGQLLLKCDDGTVRWGLNASVATAAPNPDPPLDPPPPCYYSGATIGKNMSIIINQRCREELSEKVVEKFGQYSFSVTDRRCGVSNNSDEESIRTSPLCFSPIGSNEGIQKTIVHTLRLPMEDYFEDYALTRKARTKSKKKVLEQKWNTALLNSASMLDWDFERVTIIWLKEIPSTRRKRATGTPSGIDVTGFVQFGPGGADVNDTMYVPEFEANANNGDNLGGYPLTKAAATTEAPGNCPDLGTIKASIPDDIWTASGFANDTVVSVGTIINFKCPSDKKLSVDKDGYDQFDDKFSLLCSTLNRYMTPGAWPTCVNPCPRTLPTPPTSTGLEPVMPPNTIPAGQKGRYVCTNADMDFTVNEGPSATYEVMCLDSKNYSVPATDDLWPVCALKTTTVSPVIKVAMKDYLAKFKWKLEYRYKVWNWKAGEAGVVPDEGKDWFTIVTIPCMIGICIFIMICLCCTRKDSPICNICGDPARKYQKRELREVEEPAEEAT